MASYPEIGGNSPVASYGNKRLLQALNSLLRRIVPRRLVVALHYPTITVCALRQAEAETFSLVLPETGRQRGCVGQHGLQIAYSGGGITFLLGINDGLGRVAISKNGALEAIELIVVAVKVVVVGKVVTGVHRLGYFGRLRHSLNLLKHYCLL